MEKARLQCKAELREREGKIAAKELQVGGLTWLSRFQGFVILHLITAARITWIIRVLCGSWQVIAYFKYNSQLKKLLEKSYLRQDTKARTHIARIRFHLQAY